MSQQTEEVIRELRKLIKSPGWVQLLKIADAQIETRRRAIILSPLKAMDEVLEQEYAKGEIAGIMLFLSLPETWMQSLMMNADKLEKEDARDSDE